MRVKHTSRVRQNLYRGYLDYDGALAELEIARQSLPNDARIFELMGYIQRRQGHWEESTRNLERAVELDPRNRCNLLWQIALNYWMFRRYAEEKSVVGSRIGYRAERCSDAKCGLRCVEL